MSRLLGFVMLGMLLLPWGAPRASTPPPQATLDSTQDWARYTSARSQEAARSLFHEGNELLKDGHLKKAVERYRRALVFWEHPAIHYNLALARLNLDQPLELYEDLQEAVRYGPQPLDPQKYEFARNTLRLLEKQQIARIDVSCDEPGAVVTLDGKTLFTAPGRVEKVVLAGAHSIVATKAGYLTVQEKTQRFPAGEKTAVHLEMYVDRIVYKRPGPVWPSWAMVGVGAALVAGGGLLHVEARDSIRGFDAGVLACDGCFPEPVHARQLSRGNTLQRTAVGSYFVGGGAMAVGAVFLYLNRPQPFREIPGKGLVPVSVVPVIGSGTGGAQATFQF
jgi:hypothetical protein